MVVFRTRELISRMWEILVDWEIRRLAWMDTGTFVECVFSSELMQPRNSPEEEITHYRKAAD